MNNSNEYKMTQAVYVHIPFCRQKCLYCDFASYAGCGEQEMRTYADAVCSEIAGRADEGKNVADNATIYFGGGTPSTLPTEALNKIVRALKQYGFWRSPAEATIEVNPGTADLEKLRYYKALGFDRISFGVQSLNDNELKTIGRIHSAAEALEALKLAKEAGFKRISVDLIYGLPNQTLDSLKDTLERLLKTGIEHISVYGLIVEDGTPLASLVENGRLQLPDEDTAADMYELVQRMMKEAGFTRYEISNYAKNEQYSRHNLVYWQYHPYAGFGAAASGFDGRVRRSAVETVADYINGVHCLFGADNGKCKSVVQCSNCCSSYEAKSASKSGFQSEDEAFDELYLEEKLSTAELFGEFMFMGLRCSKGADINEAHTRFGIDVWEKYTSKLHPLIEHKLLVYDAECGYLRLTEQGMAVGNQIFEIFI